MAGMAESPPLWRQAVDAVDRVVAPPIKTIVNSEPFAIAAGLVARAQRTAQQRSERATRRMLHLWNLPAGSDVTRIIGEIGKLQRQVADLTKQLNAVQAKEGEGGGAKRNGGAARAREAGR